MFCVYGSFGLSVYMYMCVVSVMCAVYVWYVLWMCTVCMMYVRSSMVSVYGICVVSVWHVWYMCHVSECDGGIWL